MVYCKKFIDGIGKINFDQKTYDILRNPLIAFAHDALTKELETINKILEEELPKSREASERREAVIAREGVFTEGYESYKAKLEENKKAITEQLNKIFEKISEDEQTGQKTQKLNAIKKNLPTTLNDEQFLNTFAEKFRNISHLADTLSDAPPAIKDLQTKLYAKILFKLDKKDQEDQVKTLSDENLIDMAKQAVKSYEGESSLIRNQYQTLAQMAVYQLVQRECEKFLAKEANEQNYVSSIKSLMKKIGDKNKNLICSIF